MGIPIVQGRDFDVQDNQVAMRVAIVNETLAREFWPGRDAIGQEVMPGARVVGIARDIRQEALDSRQGPAFYLPFEQRDGLAAAPNFVVIRTYGDPRDFVPTLKSVVRSVDRRQPVVDIQTMEEVLGRSIAQRRLLMSLMAGFAALAVLLSTAGIYGVLSYIVADRTREIGIRMCLGARSSGIVALVAKQLLGPMASGLLAGLAVSLLAARVLSHWLFSVRSHDVLTLITAAALTAAIAILGGAIPVIRAVRVDPMSAVRME
jgi:ABC-type antimicrobial peptide transport system permease subunit